jgi:hypothetical protein
VLALRHEVLIERKKRMAVKTFDVWKEVNDFLTSTPTPEQILAFRPSQAAQDRLRDLLRANQERSLTPDEQTELEETQAVENFMRRLKVEALAR